MAMTILIVDDHPSFRDSARMLLEAEGYEVVGEAADGETAVSSVHELQPDVVLLDVDLPDLDGFEVASRVAGLERAPRVVLTSNYEWEDFGRPLETSGARGFIPKPELSGRALAELVA